MVEKVEEWLPIEFEILPLEKVFLLQKMVVDLEKPLQNEGVLEKGEIEMLGLGDRNQF